MSDTYRHKKRGKYNKAYLLHSQGKMEWINWHPFELDVIPIHENGSLIKPVKFGNKVLQFGYYEDGHGIAQFELVPKFYRKYSNLYVRHKSYFHNLYHTRPGRRWNKRQLKKMKIMFDNEFGFWYDNSEFRDYNKKPETWED